MYLSRFGVKNYKCLGEIDIPLTPIHVLIGQNDCGKTSLLEAMAAFFGTADKPIASVFPQPWVGRELVQQGIETAGASAENLYATVVNRVERELIVQVMAACDNVQIKAAERLGINRNTLHKKLKEYGLEK